MALLDSIVATYGGAKAWLFVLAALVLRRKMRSPIPLALVAFFAVLNEAFDLLAGGTHQALEPYVDIANTMFWPTVLFLLARRWR